MNAHKSNHAIMEDYVMGKLSSQELSNFEQQLQNDPDLKQSLEDYKLLVAGIKYSGRHQLLNKLKAIEEEFSEKSNKTKTVRLIPRRFYYIAASLAIILVSLILIFRLPEPSSRQLAQAYFNPYPTTIGSSTRSINQNHSDLDEAMNNFEAGNFDKSIEILKTLPIDKNEYIIQFYLANAYQAKSSFDEAEKIYIELQQRGGELQDQVNWYLSLCYLEQNKTSLAKQTLQQLAEGKSSYKSKASELLSKID